MIVLLVVDTSESMGTTDVPTSEREGAPKLSRLDTAKACLEALIRMRPRGSPSDLRFMLIATPLIPTEPPRVLAGWGCDVAEVEFKLKNLEPSKSQARRGVDSPAPWAPLNSTLSAAFQLLSRQRLQKNADTCGFGRQPWAIDAATIILVVFAATYLV